MKRISIFFILVMVGGLFFVHLDYPQVFALGEFSDNVKKLCENKYDSYKKMGKDSLIEANSHITYLPNCFVLFEDPNWDFKGKDKIDRYYDKYYQATSQVNPLINGLENQKIEIKNVSSMKIGYQKYAIKFRICAEEKTIFEPKFFVVTDKEYYLAKSNRTLKENSCNFVMTYANLQDPVKVSLFPFDGNYMPSKFLKVKSVY